MKLYHIYCLQTVLGRTRPGGMRVAHEIGMYQIILKYIKVNINIRVTAAMAVDREFVNIVLARSRHQKYQNKRKHKSKITSQAKVAGFNKLSCIYIHV